MNRRTVLGKQMATKKLKTKTKSIKKLKHQTLKVTPKKLKNQHLSKVSNRSSRAKVSNGFLAKVPSTTVLLSALLFIIIIFTMRFMYDSANEARIAYAAADHDANSLLAYTKEQITVAGIVGDKKQLQSEIIGLQEAPEDLQAYALKDYKQFKKSCVVNDALVSTTSYEIVNVVYDRFALVNKDCNGKQQSILSKISGKWIVVYSGNITIPCTLVNDFDIPQGISRNCTDNGVEYLNPNP